MKFALFLVLINANPADDGRDSWFVLDGDMTRTDCETRMEESRHAVNVLFGDTTAAILVCEEDNAANHWD